jgi:hypothetical protein
LSPSLIGSSSHSGHGFTRGLGEPTGAITRDSLRSVMSRAMFRSRGDPASIPRAVAVAVCRTMPDSAVDQAFRGQHNTQRNGLDSLGPSEQRKVTGSTPVPPTTMARRNAWSSAFLLVRAWPPASAEVCRNVWLPVRSSRVRRATAAEAPAVDDHRRTLARGQGPGCGQRGRPERDRCTPGPVRRACHGIATAVWQC